MELVVIEERRLLRFSLLLQLYRDFFTYGYEVCKDLNYSIPNQYRIEVIDALYFLFYRRFIFFNIERDKTVSAYMLGRGIEEAELYLFETSKLVVSNVYRNILIPVCDDEEEIGGAFNDSNYGSFI